MAISKELYERYKAMKAAKLAQSQAEQNFTVPTAQIYTEPQNDANIPAEKIPVPESSWTTTYANEKNDTQTEGVTYTGNLNLEKENFLSQKINTNQTIKKFALIGYPLGHSLSEYIHLAGFKSLGIKATYEILPTLPEELADRIKYLRNNGYSGFNVTIPHKLPVTMFLDEIDNSANVVNAINTVTIDAQKNLLKGYNTDAIGFIKAIPDDFSLYEKKIGVLGTGGAARAAITALAQRQVKEINLYTRNIANCIELLEYLRKTFPNIEFNAYQIDKFKDLSRLDMVINATPLGMSGKGVGYSPLKEDEITTLPSHAIIYDVIYNPKKTNLIKYAQKYNYKTINGMDMLIYQAQEAQKIWTGQIPDFKDMKIAALENISD